MNLQKEGITKAGQPTADLVENSVGWLSQPNCKNDKRGDLQSNHSDMLGEWVEVKKGVWNQCRPYKYMVHVGYNAKKDLWFVVPPHVIIKLTATRKGQHTVNSMECVGLSAPTQTNWAKDYVVNATELGDAILYAYKESHSSENLKYKKFAKKCREKLELFVEEQKADFEKMREL